MYTHVYFQEDPLPPAFRNTGIKHMATFGEALRALRTEKGLTLEELAARADVSYGAISDWERGKRNPLRKNVVAVADALGVPRARLLLPAGFVVDGDDASATEVTLESGTTVRLWRPDGKQVTITEELLRRIELEDELQRRRGGE